MSRLEKARVRLAEHYRQSLAGKIETLTGAARALAAGDPDAPSSIRRIAHQLRGSGASFGIPRITDSAALVEDAPEQGLAAALDGLIEVLAEASVEGSPRERTTILIVEDDQQQGDLLERILEAPGRVLRRASTVAGARSRLEAGGVDLVVLDLTLPDGDGRNLLAELQDRSETATVPVIVLSATPSPRTKAECLSLGAEQYLDKPVVPELITVVISGILERRQRHAEDVGLDTLTGLANRHRFGEQFQRAAKLSMRADVPNALAIVDLDRFKRLNDTYGHNFGDQVLRRTGQLLSERLRQTDFAGRWGGEEFVVLFQSSTADQALVGLRKVQQALRAERFEVETGEPPEITFSGGVVDVELDETLTDALARADKLLYGAKRAGRDRILCGAPAALEQEVVRILLAEDDTDVAALVSASLSDKGFQVDHHPDGRLALEAALRSHFDLAILDKGMPGLDGFEVLRQLRLNGGYKDVPIIMLTAVGREEEIERAFDLGADDYVQKPFKPRELLARTRRLLRR